jgi:hypothetical protein
VDDKSVPEGSEDAVEDLKSAEEGLKKADAREAVGGGAG